MLILRKNEVFLEIEYEQSRFSSNIIIVRLRGTLEANNFLKLSNVFNKLLEGEKYYIILEMSCLTFISSSAVGMLMGYKRRLVEKNGNLMLAATGQEMKAKLNLMGADKVFSFYSDIRTAVNRFMWKYEKNEEVVNISLPVHMAYVPIARRFISRIALQKSYSRKDCFRIETIVDEICNNAIEHGNNTDNNNHIQIRFSITNDKIELHVINRTNQKNVDEMKKYMEMIDEKKALPMAGERGRGLSLVRKLSDELKVEITEVGTNVHITKSKEDYRGNSN